MMELLITLATVAVALWIVGIVASLAIQIWIALMMRKLD
jgi:hypothetical protein